KRPPGNIDAVRDSHSSKYLLAALLVAGCLFFIGLGRAPLLEPDEGRNAEVAREMLVSGRWITPHFDTLPYLDKPVIVFWMVAGCIRLFGASEWAGRFPSALMAMATAVLVWMLAKRMFSQSSGTFDGARYPHGAPGASVACIVWATCPLVLAFAREVILDMTL